MSQKLLFYLFCLVSIENIWGQEAKEYYEKAQEASSKKLHEEANKNFQKASKEYLVRKDWDSVLVCQNHILVNLILVEADNSQIEAHIKLTQTDIFPKTRQLEVQAYNHFITAHYYLQFSEDYEQALLEYKKSLVLYRQSQNQKRITQTLMNLGIVYRNLQDYKKAIQTYQNALELLNEESDKLLFAETYNLLGVAYLFNKNYVEAEINFLKSKNIFHKLDTSTLSIKKFYRDLLHNMGILYQAIQEYDTCFEYYQKNLAINEELQDSLAIALLYNEWGNLYKTQNKQKEALTYYQKALHFLKKGTYPQTRELILKNIAYILFEMRQYEQARFYNQKVFALYEGKTEDNSQWYKHYCFLKSSLFAKQEQYDSAYLYVQKASEANIQWLGKKKRFYEPLVQLHIFKQEANILEKTQPSKLLPHYLACDTLIREVLAQYHYQSNQLTFLDISSRIYQQALSFTLAQWETTQDDHWQQWILFFSERKKAQVLQTQITELRLNQVLDIPPKVLEEKREIQRKIAYFNHQLSLNNIQKQHINYIDSLIQYDEQYQSFIENIKTKYPKFYHLKYSSTNPSLASIQKTLSEKEAILSYNLGAKEMLVLVITSTALYTQKIAISQTDLDIKIEDFRDAILSIEDKDIQRLAKELYDILIRPLKTWIKDKTTLRIITEGKLQICPLDALIDETGQFLIEEKIISQHLSINLFQEAQKITLPKDTSFIGFAPVFSKIPHIPELSYSRKEVENIAQLFQTKKLLIEEKASKQALLNLKKNYTYIHLSTHSNYSRRNPNKHQILFYPSEDEEHLYLEEIYALNLQGHLLVLSSCESGLGKEQKGEGILSLGRAFLYIGIPNIVYSLWKVKEKITQEFMQSFYEAILQGNNYATALREAKIKLIKNKIYASPRWWASFVLVGGDI